MATHLTPHASGPRRSGDHMTPDAGQPLSNPSRGTYPADNGGPSEFRVPNGVSTRSGDSMSPDVPGRDTVDRTPPRKGVAANTTTNPLR